MKKLENNLEIYHLTPNHQIPSFCSLKSIALAQIQLPCMLNHISLTQKYHRFHKEEINPQKQPLTILTTVHEVYISRDGLYVCWSTYEATFLSIQKYHRKIKNSAAIAKFPNIAVQRIYWYFKCILVYI